MPSDLAGLIAGCYPYLWQVETIMLLKIREDVNARSLLGRLIKTNARYIYASLSLERAMLHGRVRHLVVR
jgi:hypothetical protein